MKIDRIETLVVELPTKRVHRLAVATMTSHTQVIVRLYTSDGALGLGEIAVVPHYSANSPGSVKAMIDEVLTPAVLGCDPRLIVDLHARMDRAIKGNGFAKAGIEMACLDAAARALNVPVSALLGGASLSRIPVLRILGNGEIGPDVEEAERYLEDRINRLFLVKLGKGPKEENVARALAIKKALGERAMVRVDANQGWDEATATWCIERLEAGGIEAAEQPVPAWDREAMRRLARRFTIPIMADEAVATLDDAMAFAREGAADAFSIKPIKHGGLYRARQVASIAEAAGISLFGGTMGEGMLGSAACAQLFSTFHALAWGCQLCGPQLLADDIAQTAVQYQDFELVVPTGPGFGIALDEDKLRHYARRAST